MVRCTLPPGNIRWEYRSLLLLAPKKISEGLCLQAIGVSTGALTVREMFTDRAVTYSCFSAVALAFVWD